MAQKQLTSTDSSTGEVLGKVKISSKQEISRKVAVARKASQGWKDMGVEQRVKHLRKVVDGFVKRKDEFSQLISREVGMPISESVHDVEGSIEFFEWYLDNAKKYLEPEIVYKDKQQTHFVYREPFGVVAAITPWNFPASNFVWMCGQSLVSGNTVVFKDSEEVPLCGKLIEEIVESAKLPEGVFSEVYGDGKVGQVLVDQDIDMIVFTGSTATGQVLYKKAAEKFIRVFLELGGSAPGIVFEDADVDKVLDTIYANRFDNCGQICDGLKRLIVHESKYKEVLDKLSQKLSSVKVGEALDKNTNIGPLVSAKQLKILKKQVADARKNGAKEYFVYDLDKKLKGHFYPPTILTNIKTNMQVWTEEVFGPVLPVVKFKTEAEAIKLANDTRYGLGGYVFTEDKEKALRVSQQIKTGMMQMNNTCYVTPSSPFGGCKMSGIGREHGKFGFYDMTEPKLIALEN